MKDQCYRFSPSVAGTPVALRTPSVPPTLGEERYAQGKHLKITFDQL